MWLYITCKYLKHCTLVDTVECATIEGKSCISQTHNSINPVGLYHDYCPNYNYQSKGNLGYLNDSTLHANGCFKQKLRFPTILTVSNTNI